MNLLKHQFVRFLLVGVLNTLFGYSVFAFLIFLKVHYSLAALLSTVLGGLFNFKTTGRLVFRSSDNRLVIKFTGVYVVVYLLNISCLKIFTHFNVSMYFAGAILVLPMALVSFLLNRKFVFNKEEG